METPLSTNKYECGKHQAGKEDADTMKAFS